MKELFDLAKNLTPGVVLVAFIVFFFYLYSITGDILFLILSGVSIFLIPVIYMLKGPFEIWRSTREPIVAQELGDLIGSLPMYLATRRYRHAYFEFLTARHSIFDVKGLTTQGVYSLDLEKVFVDLSIVAEPLSQNDLLTPPRVLGEGRRDIWAYLKTPEYKHLAIIGSPGCGKTTLLKYITLSLIHRKWRTRKEILAKLPIFLYLRDHAQAISDNPEIKLVDLIHQSLHGMKDTVSTPTGWFESHLKRGHCLIMLDGLDEVGDPTLRKKVTVWISKAMEAYYKNRFIVSARPHGYHSNPIQGMTQLQVQNFNSEQIQKFIENWYRATEVMSQQRPKEDERVRLAAQEGAEDLLKRIQNTPDLAALALNPLLLTMIANVHRWRSSLPGRRVELYAEMCEVFLGKRHQASGVEDGLTPAQKQSVLQALAYQMMQQETREMPLSQILNIIDAPLKLVAGEMKGEAFVHLIRDGSGILIEHELETYAFSHKTFQEFLAAVYIEKEKCLPKLLAKIDEDWWHETIRLYCARNDATPVITNCLIETPPPLKRLVLAIGCADEALQLDNGTRKQLHEMIEEALDSNDKTRRTIAAQAKLAWRLAHLSRLDDIRYADNTLIPHAEFQLFLDEQPRYTPDHWTELGFPKGRARSPVKGVSPAAAEAFCDWLTRNNLQGVRWRYRLPKQNELDPGDYWVKTQEAYVLSQPHPVQQSLHDWIRMGNDTSEAILPPDLLRENITVDCHQFLIRDLFQRTYFKFETHAIVSDHDSDRAIAIAIAIARASDSPLVSDRALALTRALNSDFALNSDLNSDLDSAIDRARALARALAGDLDSALALAHALALGLARARSIARSIDSDRDRARSSDRALVRDLDRARALVRDLDLDLTITLDRALDRALDSSFTLDSAFALDSTIGHALARDIDSAFALDSDLDSAIGHTSKNIIVLLEVFGDTSYFISLLAEWFIRGDGYSSNLGPTVDKDLASFRQSLLKEIQVHHDKQPNAINRLVGSAWQIWRDKLDQLLNTYAQFVTLEMRRQGKWPAFEGIRIAREKVAEQSKEKIVEQSKEEFPKNSIKRSKKREKSKGGPTTKIFR